MMLAPGVEVCVMIGATTAEEEPFHNPKNGLSFIKMLSSMATIIFRQGLPRGGNCGSLAEHLRG